MALGRASLRGPLSRVPMRIFLLSLLVLAASSGYAQTTAAIEVPAKAAAKLERVLKQTQEAVVIGKRAETLPVEARPMLNRILAQSTAEFLAITSQSPSKEAYFKSVDAGLNRLSPIAKSLEDRQQVAAYYEDLLDIVGIDSSDGRLPAFVENSPVAAKQ
ncbi:DUF4844 domain-containing protein [Hymenobacter armeniacus]|uniref:DUF4844 domain-containing protein n=1 Tax=Hymenobacter armeniacus TaxID=2771358 RepID=A0ABR8JVX9_9BACT|nr:DUF4844 domain-containing protein [Hymenobacter armeniacus]MBD2723071.1 DUF4844 domain-containing protein [Hymenobacter armeniacus]